MNKQDYRDKFAMGGVVAVQGAATLFLFLYPSSVNFATWAGVVATVGGWYHWLTVSDDKRVDAGNVTAVLPTEGLTDVVANELREWKGEDHGAA